MFRISHTIKRHQRSHAYHNHIFYQRKQTVSMASVQLTSNERNTNIKYKYGFAFCIDIIYFLIYLWILVKFTCID